MNERNDLFNFVYNSMFDSLKERLDYLKEMEMSYQKSDEKDDTTYTKSFHLILRSIDRLLNIVEDYKIQNDIDPEYFNSRITIIKNNLDEIQDLLKSEIDKRKAESKEKDK